MKSGSPKKSKQQAGSPQKVSTSRPSAAAEIDNLHEELKNLQFKLGDRDTEIERMEETLFALN